jgi:hypothetical protein
MSNREENLLLEIANLRAENERLHHLLKSHDKRDHASLTVQYMYASPLVLLDSLESMVIETFDPIRAEKEFFSIAEALKPIGCVPRITAATYSNLRHTAETMADIIHVSMHTIDIPNLQIRCVVDDDTGKGILMTPEEFSITLAPTTPKLVFINACNSMEIAKRLISNGVPYAICTSSQVYEASAIIFASKFYSSMALKFSVRQAFDMAKQTLSQQQSKSIAEQSALFYLLVSGRDDIGIQYRIDAFQSRSCCPKNLSVPFYTGYIAPDIQAEDFLGRQVDIVRLGSLMFASSVVSRNGLGSRRICLVSGVSGIGKDIFLSEFGKFFSSPGGQKCASICMMRVPRGGTIPALTSLRDALRKTVKGLSNWSPNVDSGILEIPENDLSILEETEDIATVRPRLDSSMSAGNDTSNTEINELKSYKVFWAETFKTALDLVDFLRSYELEFSEELGIKLFTELRSNGSQLQDWGQTSPSRSRCSMYDSGFDFWIQVSR